MGWQIFHRNLPMTSKSSGKHLFRTFESVNFCISIVNKDKGEHLNQIKKCTECSIYKNLGARQDSLCAKRHQTFKITKFAFIKGLGFRNFSMNYSNCITQTKAKDQYKIDFLNIMWLYFNSSISNNSLTLLSFMV